MSNVKEINDESAVHRCQTIHHVIQKDSIKGKKQKEQNNPHG